MLIVVHDLRVRVLDERGDVIRDVTLDPTSAISTSIWRELSPEIGANDVSRHHRTDCHGADWPSERQMEPQRLIERGHAFC